MEPGKIKTGRKIIFSVLLIVLALGISSFSSSFQYTAERDTNKLQKQLTRKLTQVTGVWVQVKVVSGVISVLGTIQVEGSIPVIGGLAVSVEPLGWTDVVDNTLDHISNICLWAMGALAIEKILLAVSIWLSLRIVVPACVVFIIIAIWNKKYAGQLRRTIAGIVIISTGICTAIPLSLELSNMIEANILSNQIQKTVDEIDGKAKEAEKIGDDVDKSSFMDKLNQVGRGVADFFSGIKQTFDSFIDNMINYIMCFIVTNLIIPIGTLLCLKYLLGVILKFIKE